MNTYHDYQKKIWIFKHEGIIPEGWMIQQQKDCQYYFMKGDNAVFGSDDFIELVWYQLDEQ